MDEQENNDRQNRRDRRAMDNQILTTLVRVSMRAEDFGPVFSRVRTEFYNGNITEGSMQRIAVIGRVCLKVGMPLSLLKYTPLMDLVRVPGGTFRQYTRRITRVIYDMKTDMVLRRRHNVITARPHRQNEVPVDADSPPSVIVGSEQLERYNVRFSEPWLGPDPLSPLRGAPSSLQGETHIPFNDGERPFPTYLLAMGEVTRYNQPDRLVAFDRAAMYAQIPDSLPLRVQTMIRGELERMNTRIKPSSQFAFAQISRASKKTNEMVNVGHLVAALCFMHYHLDEEGRNAFLYRQLKAMGLTEVTTHSFPWRDRIQGIRVVGADGQRLRIDVRDPMVRRSRVSRFESTKNGKSLKRQTLYKYKGLDRDGCKLYEAFRDDLPGLEAQLADLRQLRLDSLTDRDVAIREGDEAWDNENREEVQGNLSDDEGNKVLG